MHDNLLQSPPHVAWCFDGNPITTCDMYEITDDHENGVYSLYLPECFPEDSGVYTLSAKTPEMSEELEVSATLTVLGESHLCYPKSAQIHHQTIYHVI